MIYKLVLGQPPWDDQNRKICLYLHKKLPMHVNIIWLNKNTNILHANATAGQLVFKLYSEDLVEGKK